MSTSLSKPKTLSLKSLQRQTHSIVDYTPFLNSANVESITLRILEDKIDVLLEMGYSSVEEAYAKINETSDIIHYVQDWCNEDSKRSRDAWFEEFSVERHEEMIFEHLCFLHRRRGENE